MAKESLGGTARKALITAVVSVLFLPVSGVLGYVLAKFLQAPRLQIQYVTAEVERSPRRFGSGVLRENSELAARLRSIIAAAGDPDYRCRRWIDGEPWHDQCLSVTEDAAHYLRSDYESIVQNLEALQAAGGPGDRTQQQMALTRVKKTRADIEKFIDGLRTLQASPPGERTGIVTLVIGVLNSGDSDGVVTRNGRLTVVDVELPIVTERYTLVKAHSFEEVRFSLDRSNAKISALERWQSLVKGGIQERFQVTLTEGSGRALAKETRLPQ